MHILDDKKRIKKLDSKNMLASIQLLANQAKDAWEAGKKISLPPSYKKIRRIVVAGMGGSALGAHLLKSVFGKLFTSSFEIINGYYLPDYIGRDSLVIISSYSGNTEESLAAAQNAIIKKAKIFTITAGGKLADWAKKNNTPALIFATDNNPCGSPRMGLGYGIFGLAVFLKKIGLLKISEAEFCSLLGEIAAADKKFGVENPVSKNTAKQLARELLNRSVWYLGAEHLAGNAHIAANQMNENAKRFAGYFLIPELNHHLMEGMMYPDSNRSGLVFVLLLSKLYDQRIQKRFLITKEVLAKNKIKTCAYECQANTRLGQACEALVFSSYLSYYSAILGGIDPTAIPFVDFFKERLKK